MTAPYRRRVLTWTCRSSLALLLAACGQQQAVNSSETAAWRPGSDSPQQHQVSQHDDGGPRTVQASARFLAGLQAADLDPIPTDLLEPWRPHAKAMDSAWQRLAEDYLHPIDRFTSQHLAALTVPTAPLFYPFGGPDLMHALHFFPAASTYVLVGLEEPGELPRLADMQAAELAEELGRLRQVLDNLVEAGYFVRKRMRQDLPGRWSGIVSVFYIQLARAGATPTAAHYITLDEEGIEHPLADSQTTPNAVRLDFILDDIPRLLYFFSQDLSDDGLGRNPAFGRFVDQLGPYNALLKSAQYLPHLESFSTVRAMVQAATAVLQDDSGIPFAAFDPADWQIGLFGHYAGTLAAFHEYQQDDLAHAFAERTEDSPLGFRVGYNGDLAGGGLILAERHATP